MAIPGVMVIARGQTSQLDPCVEMITVRPVTDDERRSVGVKADLQLVLHFPGGSTVHVPMPEEVFQKLKEDLTGS